MSHTTRTRSREPSANGRPSLLERTYSRMSNYGSKNPATKDQMHRTSSKNHSSNAVADPAALRSFTGVFRTPLEGCRPKPPAKLSESQEKLLAEMIVYFREKKTYPVSLNTRESRPEEPASDWEKLRMLTRESMLRYLRATKWDINAAKKRLIETIAWRREFGVDSIQPEEVEGEAKCGKETVMGFDKLARPLHYMHPHRSNTKETPTQMKFAVWILEACIDLMPPGVEQLALLINFDSRSRNPTSIANAKLMLYILQNHYVERLGIALSINVPWIFKAFWTAIQSFIDPVTKSKCKFDEDVTQDVLPAHLSADFGGQIDPIYHHEQYWPDLVKLTKERREAMLTRFRELCKCEVGASEWVIRGGNDSQEDALLQEKDISAVVIEAEDKAALARTDSSKPAEPPTIQVSDPPQVQEVDTAQISRQVAVDASQARVDAALADNSADTAPAATLDTEASTGSEAPETFKTPMDTLNANPLDRTFSTPNNNAGETISIERGATPSTSEGDAQRVETKTQPNGDSKPIVSPSRSSTPVSTTRGRKERDSRGVSGLFASISKILPNDGQSSNRNSSSSNRSGLRKKGSSVQIRILFFAAARDAAGTSSLTIPLEATPLSLKEVPALIHQSKGVKDPARLMDVIARSNWSVDQMMIDAEDAGKTQLKGGEDVAVIPPVSGG